MLKKLPVLAAMLLAGSVASNAQQQVLIAPEGVNVQEMLDGKLLAPEAAASYNNMIQSEIVENEVLPTAMMPEFIVEEFAYRTWTDSSEDATVLDETYTGVYNLPGPTIGTSFSIAGFAQIHAPINVNDPESTVTIDSMFMFMWQWQDEPRFSQEWGFFPMVFSEAATDLLMADNDSFLNMLDPTQLEFTNVNGGLQYYEVDADSLTFEARRSADEQTVFAYVQKMGDLTIPGDRAWAMVMMPIDGFSSATPAPLDSLFMWGVFEYDLPDSEALGAYITKPVGDPNTTNLIRCPQALTYNNDATVNPKLRGQAVRTNFRHVAFGVYAGEDPASNSVESDDNGLSGFTLGTSFPNPAVDVTNVPFAIEVPGTYTARVVNAMGEVVAETSFANMTPGSYNWDFSVAGFANGTYFYSLIAPNGQAVTRAFVVAK